MASEAPTRVLLIEDDIADAELLIETLVDEPSVRIEIDCAQRLSDALKRLSENAYDLVISDLNLPDSRGFATFQRVQEAVPDLPILVLTGLDDEKQALEAVRQGAQDYLVKGRVNGALLVRSIRYSIQRHQSKRELNKVAEELKVANQRLEHMAQNDPLTDLLNRRGLEEVLSREVARAHRMGTNSVVLLVDLDDFKRINDTIGHSAGDAVLKEIAARMRHPLRSTDYAARVGGDEFLILLPDTQPAEGIKIAEVVRHNICDQPIPVNSHSITATASVGVISVPPEARTIDDLLAETHHVLYRSKRHGKNRVSFDRMEPQRKETTHPWIHAVEELRKEGVFRCVLQPIFRLVDSQPVGCEILARTTIRNAENPADFFRIGMETEMLPHVERQCLMACIDASRHLPASFRRHINISPTALQELTVPRLLEMLPQGQANLFCIEVSQNQIVGDPSYLSDLFDKLKRAGVLTAIEDVQFGTNSLESLVLLEPDFAKIDRSYVTGIANDSARVRSLTRLLKMADSLGMEVIAEAIESRHDLGVLKATGLRYGQGFLWGRPAAHLDAFSRFMPERALAELRSAGGN